MTSQTPNNANRILFRLAIKLIPWILSLLIVLTLVMGMLHLQNKDVEQEETVTVRKIDVALPLPPPPPPPIQLEQSQTESNTASIDLMGMGAGPVLDYSKKPKVAKLKLAKVKLPKFDINSLDLSKTIAVDFALIEVKSLDQLPKIISSRYVQPPWSVIKRGITRIPTLVEIIIDQKGKAHIKKIVDPVYPEMVDTIRTWVENVRFSIPKKNGKPVQALYLYGLNFNYNRS
jgi:thiol-disulfide isomerase/thioredoxin